MKENSMGVDHIPKLIKSTSIPMMFSLLLNSLYNIVDSIFIAQISEDALTALSLAAPLQLVISALGCGIAVGLNAAVSKALGEKNAKKVQKVTSASLLLAVAAYVISAFIGFAFTKSYFMWQSQGNEVIYQHGVSYLMIIMLFSFGTLLQWVFDRLLIASGKNYLFLISLSVASIINLILDPILIFGYFGIPAMGTAGAAIATVVGQIIGAIAGYGINKVGNKEIPIVVEVKVELKYILEILKVGIPTMIMQAVVAFIGIAMNMILQLYSTTAIAVMGVCNRIQNMALIAPNGVNIGAIPIIAYNFGARKKNRIYESISYMRKFTVFLMLIVLLLLEVFPSQILSLFDASDMMLSIGIPAIRILAISYFISIFSMMYSTVFQSFGKGHYSMYLTILRQVILPMSLALLFTVFNNLNLIWSAFIIAEILSFPIALIMMKNLKRDIIDNL